MIWNHTEYIVPLLGPVKVGVYELVKNHQQNSPLLRTESSVTGHKIIIFTLFQKALGETSPVCSFLAMRLNQAQAVDEAGKSSGVESQTQECLSSRYGVLLFFSLFLSFIVDTCFTDFIFLSLVSVNFRCLQTAILLVSYSSLGSIHTYIFSLKNSLLGIQIILLLILGSDLSIS